MPVEPEKSARNCPVCGEPVDLKRYWLGGWAWSTWPCAKCETLLTYDRKARILSSMMGGGAGGLAGGFFLKNGLYSVVIGVVLIVIAGTIAGFVQRVTVAGPRSERYCFRCKYDLSGTLEAGIRRCPECGREVPKGLRAHSD